MVLEVGESGNRAPGFGGSWQVKAVRGARRAQYGCYESTVWVLGEHSMGARESHPLVRSARSTLR